MTSRERVLATVEHREPDRVPFNLRLAPEMAQRLGQRLGTEDYPKFFRHDVRYVALSLPPCPPGVSPLEWTPRPHRADLAQLSQAVRALHERGLATCSAYVCGVFEQAKEWLGDETALVAPYESPQEFAALLERITEWKCAVYGAYAEAGVDIVWIGDDLGTQRSLVMSPQQYRAWYRPHHEHIVNSLRRRRPTVKIAFHSCGHVYPLVGDLIEIGVDILEAVQAETMDLALLKREFGRDLCFWGGVGAQSVLQGSPEQVTEGVRATLRLMAPGGGYIAAPCHTLTEEVALDNILAFHQALARYGAYPRPGEAPPSQSA